jgi:hypothetical protein
MIPSYKTPLTKGHLSYKAALIKGHHSHNARLVIIYYLNTSENLKSGVMRVMALDESGLIRWMASLDLRGTI